MARFVVTFDLVGICFGFGFGFMTLALNKEM